MAPYSSTLAWKIPWTEEPDVLQSLGSRRVRHDWATSLLLFTFMHWRRKWQPIPVFLPGESQGWGCRVRHDCSDLAVAVAAVPELACVSWHPSLIQSCPRQFSSFLSLILFRVLPSLLTQQPENTAVFSYLGLLIVSQFFFAPNKPFNFWLFFTVSKDLHCLKNNLCRNSYFTSQRNISWKKFLKVPALASKAWVRSRLQ